MNDGLPIARKAAKPCVATHSRSGTVAREDRTRIALLVGSDAARVPADSNLAFADTRLLEVKAAKPYTWNDGHFRRRERQP